MNKDFENWQNRQDNELLFSRTVKAGKRIYYIDVKQDRKDEFYISMTESKRVQEGTETEKPVFEKHKIFLYREDIINFLGALTDAAQYVGDHRPLTPHEATAETENYGDSTDQTSKSEVNGDFEVEF